MIQGMGTIGVDAATLSRDERRSAGANLAAGESLWRPVMGRGAEDAYARARSAAEEFVAQSLVLPVLKSLREQNAASPPFAPGAYEKTISPLYDLEVASRIVRAKRFPIVDAVARNLLKDKRGFDAREVEPEQGGSLHDGQHGIEAGGAGALV